MTTAERASHCLALVLGLLDQTGWGVPTRALCTPEADAEETGEYLVRVIMPAEAGVCDVEHWGFRCEWRGDHAYLADFDRIYPWQPPLDTSLGL